MTRTSAKLRPAKGETGFIAASVLRYKPLPYDAELFEVGTVAPAFEDAVIFCGAFPAHAADRTCPAASSLSPARRESCHCEGRYLPWRAEEREEGAIACL
ncbi:hypothetical protein D6851_10060 [Altericroceibacterium spongiae]|uniref:Uncharacterized protein n=1 Tax=Altericroceibacterium spongiae TaxID=2320269 RepID=A0A420EKM3_9SPHN|nr:hypothetical protein [Altericroceibacterium spongiae]RKF21237.1 hypothetical protein D6851_10060 [Altericroceibacterium spongiae]